MTATLTTINTGDTSDPAVVNANFSALNGVAAGVTSLTQNAVVIGAGSGSITTATAMTNGQLLVGSTSTAPVAATLGTSNGLTSTTGAGTLSIAPVRAIHWLGGF